jgi:regulator of protease activity HflC (stomatin/prohibitin superfamily)
MGTVIFLALLVLVIALVVMGFRIVQQSETMVIERLGRFDRTLNSGINIIWPIIDQPRKIMWRYLKEETNGKSVIQKLNVTRIDLRETVYDFPKQSVITKDNVVTEINAILYFQITDPVKAVYEIANLPDAIEKLTQTTLRNVIGEMDLDETLTSRDIINSKLRNVLDDATHKWGVKVNRVELQDINPPHDIRDAMEKQMRAERDKRAKILEAEVTIVHKKPIVRQIPMIVRRVSLPLMKIRKIMQVKMKRLLEAAVQKRAKHVKVMNMFCMAFMRLSPH